MHWGLPSFANVNEAAAQSQCCLREGQFRTTNARESPFSLEAKVAAQPFRSALSVEVRLERIRGLEINGPAKIV